MRSSSESASPSPLPDKRRNSSTSFSRCSITFCRSACRFSSLSFSFVLMLPPKPRHDHRRLAGSPPPIQAHAKLTIGRPVGNILEQPRLLEGKPGSGFFHLHANFHQQRPAGFQQRLRARETFREGQQLLNPGHVLNRENGPARP